MLGLKKYDIIPYIKDVENNFKKPDWSYMCVTKIGDLRMKLISKEVKTVKSSFNEDFEDYLKRQQLRTTFNGMELKSFSWYRKALGLV